MSIRKKIMFLVSALIIVPMLLLLFISFFVFQNHLENSAQSYLQNAAEIFYNALDSRQQEMVKSSKMITKELNNMNLTTDNRVDVFNEKISDLGAVYHYLDFIAVVDKEGEILAHSPSLKNVGMEKISGLYEETLQLRDAVSSLTVLDLDQLYHSNSIDFKKFTVGITQNGAAENHVLTKGLASLTVAPIFTHDEIEAFLIVGDILNNDDYFPNVYSDSIKDSFLAISINGIRITSNIQSPKKKDLVGSTSPTPIHQLDKTTDYYFGRVSIDEETHVFLDLPLVDRDDHVVGVLGVGIPEHKFSVLIDTSQNLIFLVTALCLVLMMLIGRNVANRIIKPIVRATELADRISKGKNHFKIEKDLLIDDKNETTILLKTFQKMANDLKVSQGKIDIYLDELQQKNIQQEILTEQLQIFNDELEEKVMARTKDLREAIFALQKADEVKSRFLANMSHELRTPLNGIISSSEALKNEIFGPLNEKQNKYVNNILTSSNHLLQLINDILDISKIQAGKMTLTLGVYSISTIVMECYQTFKSMAVQKNIELSDNIHPSDFKIKVDAKKLRQILYNLLSNAIKFTPENGKVSLEIYKTEKFIQVKVKDNGIGIKDEDQLRVFKEFEQVDSSYARRYEGTGLGLPLTKKLVEMHGGQIYLNSTVGVGTEIIFSLPIDIDEDFNHNTNISKAAGQYAINPKTGN